MKTQEIELVAVDIPTTDPVAKPAQRVAQDTPLDQALVAIGRDARVAPESYLRSLIVWGGGE